MDTAAPEGQIFFKRFGTLAGQGGMKAFRTKARRATSLLRGLPVRKRTRLGHNNTTGRLLPAARGILPAQLILCHVMEDLRCAHDAVVVGQELWQPHPSEKLHTPSVGPRR